MLSRSGKLSAVIVFAAGALLLQSEPASAVNFSVDNCQGVGEQHEPCDARLDGIANPCQEAQGHWYYDNGYWCGYLSSCGMWCEDGNLNYSFTVDYYFNGESACPSVQPC
jgi:hypothetical protein